MRRIMSGTNHKAASTIGFLSVVDAGEQGLIGGYLVLNTLGRPLEFHCTAPVKTNRAQEILFGPTLKPFLYGEQIGQTLLEKSQFQPLFICTDLLPILSMRDTITTPVVLVQAEDTAGSSERDDERQLRIDGAHRGSTVGLQEATGTTFGLGGCRLSVAPRHAADREQVTQAWQPYADGFNLREPFDRIREAIAEAQRAR